MKRGDGEASKTPEMESRIKCKEKEMRLEQFARAGWGAAKRFFWE